MFIFFSMEKCVLNLAFLFEKILRCVVFGDGEPLMDDFYVEPFDWNFPTHLPVFSHTVAGRHHALLK